MKVTVLGAGSWGTALANLLASAGVETTLWAHEPEVVESINRDHRNPLYLSDAALDPRLGAAGELGRALDGAEMVCAVTPSHVARAVWSRAAPHVREGIPLVCATKGIEVDTLALMHQVASEVLPDLRFVALSGPSFAAEVVAGQPTAVVAASEEQEAARLVQQVFRTPTFRVYTQDDVTGVELAGALKNVMAIGAGMLEGLGLGHNPLAAYLTRGLAEITRLGVAMGAKPATFAGLAGMGDLILTCTGGLSRNRQLGIALAGGTSLEEYRAANRTVAEGVNTAVAAVRVAARHSVDLPIIGQIEAILAGRATPAESLRILMDRDPRAEGEA